MQPSGPSSLMVKSRLGTDYSPEFDVPRVDALLEPRGEESFTIDFTEETVNPG